MRLPGKAAPTDARPTYLRRRASCGGVLVLVALCGPSQPAPLQLQGVTKKKKKGSGLASWLGNLQLVKSSGTKSWTAKERLSGSGSGYDSGESISYDKGGSIFDKLLRVKG